MSERSFPGSYKLPSINEYQTDIGFSPRRRNERSPSNWRAIAVDEIKEFMNTRRPTSDPEYDNIQQEFARILQNQALRRLEQEANPTDDKRKKQLEVKREPNETIKKAKNRIGFKRGDKEAKFLRNIDSFKHLSTYFNITGLLKNMAENSDKPDLSSMEGTIFPNAPSPKATSSEIFKDKNENQSFYLSSGFMSQGSDGFDISSSKKHHKRNDSSLKLQRMLADQALQKAAEKRKVIADMKSYDSSVSNSQVKSPLLPNKQGSRKREKDELFTMRMMMQKAQEEVELDWEKHQKMREGLNKCNLLRSCIQHLENFKDPEEEGEGAFSEDLTSTAFKAVEEKFLKNAIQIDPTKDATEEEEAEVEKLLTDVKKKIKEKPVKVASDVKIAEDLFVYKERTNRVIKLLKTMTNRILHNRNDRRHALRSTMGRKFRATNNAFSTMDSPLLPRTRSNSTNPENLLKTESLTVLGGVTGKSRFSKFDNSIDANALTEGAEPFQSAKLEKKNSIRNVDFNETVGSSLNNLQLRKLTVSSMAEDLPSPKKPSFLKQPSPQVSEQLTSPLKSPNKLNTNSRKTRETISKFEFHRPSVEIRKNSIFGYAPQLSSPKLQKLESHRAEATSGELKLMKLNEKLLEIEKISEKVQKNTQKQMKRIDHQKNQIDDYYQKKQREFQVKIERVPTNLLVEKTYDKFNQRKRQEFANKLTKKLLNAMLD